MQKINCHREARGQLPGGHNLSEVSKAHLGTWRNTTTKLNGGR